MKRTSKQHLLAALGFALWAIFALPVDAHEYNWQCPDGSLSTSGPSGCRANPSPATGK